MSLIQFTQCLIVFKISTITSITSTSHPPPLFPQPKSKILLILIIHLRISESTIHWGYICSITASRCWISTYMYMYLHCNRRPGYLKLFNSGGTFDHSGGTSICCIFWDNLGLFIPVIVCAWPLGHYICPTLVFTGQPRKIVPSSVWMKSCVSMETMWKFLNVGEL